MRIVIVGPGAIGCLFAARLAAAGRDVRLLDRDPARAALIAGQGVRIEAGGRTERVPVPATADSVACGVADLVCICVKAYDTPQAAEHALPAIGPGTAVVSLQNGLGNAEAIAGRVAAARVACAVTGEGATVLGPGHVRHAGRGATGVAPFDRTCPAPALLFIEALKDTELEVRRLDDAASLLWSKLIVNAAINPVSAVWDVPNGEVWSRPELREIAAAAAREAEEVARRQGIALPYRDAAGEVADVCFRTGANVSSMLQDLQRGKRTEIDAINGAVVEAARRVGVQAPVNDMLWRRVKELEGGGGRREVISDQWSVIGPWA